MNPKKRSDIQQAIILIITVVFGILLILHIKLYNESKSIESQFSELLNYSETQKDYIDQYPTRLKEFFDTCNLREDADFIDNLIITDEKICFDCNILSSYENGVMQTKRRTICSK